MKPFFRTYKVNMENSCPFWSQQKRCKTNLCQVD